MNDKPAISAANEPDPASPRPSLPPAAGSDDPRTDAATDEVSGRRLYYAALEHFFSRFPRKPDATVGGDT